jgi:hypothetical protein
MIAMHELGFEQVELSLSYLHLLSIGDRALNFDQRSLFGILK